MASDISVGDRVRLATQPPYFKTADPMPMLRPPDTLRVGAEGVVVDRRPGGYWGIKFDQGSFLLDSQYLEKVIQQTRAEIKDADTTSGDAAIDVAE